MSLFGGIRGSVGNVGSPRVQPTMAYASPQQHQAQQQVQQHTPQATAAQASAAQPPVIAQEELVRAFLEKLFDLQEKRARTVAESRQLLKDMSETKTWLQRHMARENVPELCHPGRGRHLKRKTRKIYHKVDVKRLLDKIEQQYGVGERRKFDLWIEQTEDTVAKEIVEYKITYANVRKAGEHNAGAMPARRKRAAPTNSGEIDQFSASASSSSASNQMH
jgi:hypothetical protein